MSDIPTDLFNNILIRLPVESLLFLRGVCKSWKQIIDDPVFIKSQFKHQSSNNGLGQLLVRNEQGGKLLCLSLDSLHFDSLDSLQFVSENRSIEATYVKNLVRPGLPRLSTLPVASCNGLILIAHDDAKKIWVLWNPLTQEYYELPKCDSDLSPEGCGLGYDCVNDDYKVVRINLMPFRCNGEYVYTTFIYSLKLDSWKQIKDFPCSLYNRPCQAVYMSGSLYMVSDEFLIALNLTTEEYSQLPLPFFHSKIFEENEYWGMELDVLGGCLVLSCAHKRLNCGMSERFEGWMMKDDGGKIMWTKLFSFEKLDDAGFTNHRPTTYSKSNKHILIHRYHEFFWLNTVDNCAKKVRIHGLDDSFYGGFSCQIWQGSLFRLGNIVRAKRIQPVKRMKAKKRLELKVTIEEALGCSTFSNDN